MCLSIPFSNKADREFIAHQMDEKFALQEEETCYLPAEMKDGILTSGLMVSEGTLVPAPAHNMDNMNKSEEIVVEQGEVDEKRESVADILEIADEPSVAAEVVGETVEGSADGEGNEGVSIEGITQNVPRPKLAQATLEDTSLEAARTLAAANKDRYHFSDGILFRTRLDQFGQAREQIWLPQEYRSKCIALAHTHFGHQGCNKMVQLIRPFFHWPQSQKIAWHM